MLGLLANTPQHCSVCCALAVLLESEKLVVVQLLLLLCLLETSSSEPPLPLLGIQGEHDHQTGLEQVAGPAVDL